jgi:enoyl-CoA hydratase/carnithine racemase
VQVRRGIMPDAFSHWTVTRAAGLAAAAEVLLTGRTFTGAELVALGLASRCLPADEVLPAALDLARDMAVNVAPVSVAVSKRLLWRAVDAPAQEVGQLETDLHLHLLKLADAREGPMAFIERRTPNWTGRVSADWPEGW